MSFRNQNAGAVELPLALVAGLCLFACSAVAAQDATTFTVSPGESIQAALDKAAPGDRVQVLPGEYEESIAVETEGVELAGLEYEGEKAVLLGAAEIAVGIRVTASRVQLSGFVIRDFVEAGLIVRGVAECALRDLIVYSSGATGISISDTNDATITRCVVRGAARVGIAIRDSMNTSLRDCEVYKSGIGVMLAGTFETMIDNVSLHHNGVGLFVSGEKETDFTRVVTSRIWGNGGWAGSLPGDPPPGVGIFVQGADHTEIARSYIEDNETYGIMVRRGAGVAMSEPVGSAGVSDHTYIHHNSYSGNGTKPSGKFEQAYADIPAGDLYWDGTGERNQWQESAELKTHPEKLIAEQGGVHTEVIHFL